jgi:hypothetical protein
LAHFDEIAEGEAGKAVTFSESFRDGDLTHHTPRLVTGL